MSGSPEPTNQKDEKSATNKRKIVFLVIAILLLILLLFRCNVFAPGRNIGPGDVTVGTIDLPGKSGADLQEWVNGEVEKGMVQVFINTSITANEKNEIDILVQNTEKNHYGFQVDILDQQKRVLYQTDIVNPGYKVEKGTLNVDLADGIHDCIAVFHILDDVSAEINTIKVPVQILKGTTAP